MIRIDPTMIAEIGAWQNFPPRSGLRRMLNALAGRIGIWASRSRQRRALSELDDRLLRDIGVTPHSAAQEAGKPFWR